MSCSHHSYKNLWKRERYSIPFFTRTVWMKNLNLRCMEGLTPMYTGQLVPEGEIWPNGECGRIIRIRRYDPAGWIGFGLFKSCSSYVNWLDG